MSEGGPRLERSVRVLGGERAGRFRVDEGQTLEVTLRVDPENPRRVRFEAAMEWELERSYTHRRVGLVVMLGSVLLAIAGAWLYVRCRRVMRRDAVPRSTCPSSQELSERFRPERTRSVASRAAFTASRSRAAGGFPEGIRPPLF
jgi:hypothetical protein